MKANSTVPLSFLLPGWLRSPWLAIGVAKEAREILPYWMVSLLTGLIGFFGLVSTPEGVRLAILFGGELATVAMGAAVFGQEFTHGTMSLFLIQPWTRHQLWRRKMEVLGFAMATVFLVRLAGPLLHGAGWYAVSFAGLMSVAAILYGLTLAPALALWSRSFLAGTVFAVSMPVITWLLASLIMGLVHGIDQFETWAVREGATRLFVLMMVAQWAVGVWWTYRAFLKLEVAGSREVAIRLPGGFWRKSAAHRAQPKVVSAWRALVGKELRLLAPAYLVAVIYLALAAMDILRRVGQAGGAADIGEFLGVATLIYGALVSLLIGSLACAEDRHAGTLAWQLVQPVAASGQWMIKAGVALGMTLLLAVGLPTLVLRGTAASGLSNLLSQFPPAGWLGATVQVLGLCTVGLYLSSVASTTMRAMLWAVPIGLTLETALWGLIDSPATRSWFWNWLVPFDTHGRTVASAPGVMWLLVWAFLGLGFLVIPLACAYRNFRSLEQSAARVVAHLGIIVWYGLMALAAGTAFKQGIEVSGMTLPERAPTEAKAHSAKCADQLFLLETAVNLWAKEHSNQPPPDLVSLANLFTSPGVVTCLADKARNAAEDWDAWNPGKISYVYEQQSGPRARLGRWRSAVRFTG
jgi:hypothetical protein